MFSSTISLDRVGPLVGGASEDRWREWAVVKGRPRDSWPPPLRLAVGERVLVGDWDGEWPEFVFVTGAHGKGWVPARHLSGSSGAAVVQTPYETTELRTEIGDVLEVAAQDL